MRDFIGDFLKKIEVEDNQAVAMVTKVTKVQPKKATMRMCTAPAGECHAPDPTCECRDCDYYVVKEY